MSSVKSLVAEFSKTYKKQLGVYFGDDPERLPTGLFPLDLATGGGFPMGRISVVYGHEASMKTTVCLRAIASAQRMFPDRTPVFIDVEGHFSRGWVEHLGVDLDRLVYVIPDSAEQTIDMVESLLYADDVSVVVVDSLAALMTGREYDASAEDTLVAPQALAINKFYRKVGHALAELRGAGKTIPTLLLINQVRFKIGGMGDPEVQPGGPSFRFASSLTVRLYGRDEMDPEVSKKLPAFKKVSVIVKKHKVPIVQRNAEMLVALVPSEKYRVPVGGAVELNTILSYLKAYELFAKRDKGGGWALTVPGTGELLEFSTQDGLKNRLLDDAEFSAMVKAGIISMAIERGGLDE